MYEYVVSVLPVLIYFIFKGFLFFYIPYPDM